MDARPACLGIHIMHSSFFSILEIAHYRERFVLQCCCFYAAGFVTFWRTNPLLMARSWLALVGRPPRVVVVPTLTIFLLFGSGAEVADDDGVLSRVPDAIIEDTARGGGPLDCSYCLKHPCCICVFSFFTMHGNSCSLQRHCENSV